MVYGICIYHQYNRIYFIDKLKIKNYIASDHCKFYGLSMKCGYENILFIQICNCYAAHSAHMSLFLSLTTLSC